MNEKNDHNDPSEEAIEREIRMKRKFSLAEAVGREGGNYLKGASPVPPLEQATLVIEQFIRANLPDGERAMQATLIRRVNAAETLVGEHIGHPLEALARLLDLLLKSDTTLDGFTRDVDAEWGRIYLERPKFNLPGRPEAPDDPYTPQSVRAALTMLSKAIDAPGEAK